MVLHEVRLLPEENLPTPHTRHEGCDDAFWKKPPVQGVAMLLMHAKPGGQGDATMLCTVTLLAVVEVVLMVVLMVVVVVLLLLMVVVLMRSVAP